MTQEFCVALCWFLRAEGREEDAWDYLTAESKARRLVLLSGMTPSTWNHHLLGGIINAHIAWSSDRSADSAIMQLKRAVNSLGTSQDSQNKVGFVASTMALGRNLGGKHPLKCSPDLYDWYHDNMFVWTKDREIIRLKSAEHMLFHPTRADGLPWYEMVENHVLGAADTYIYGKSHPSAEQGRRNVRWIFTVRAAYILRLQGDHARADWLDEIVERHHKPVWIKYDNTTRDFDADPSLQHVRDAAAAAGRYGDLDPSGDALPKRLPSPF
jgi:hypothetical protein